MDQPFLSEIQIFAFNFAPRGWAMCNGQLLAIAQNTALFSLLGTTFGGNGQTTFALPDMRGRVAIHPGNSGQGTYVLGQAGGSQTVTLTQPQLPAHTHTAVATSTTASETYPATTNTWAAGAAEPAFASGANNVMAPTTINVAGGSQPHQNRSPYLALNICIALEGIFPSRN